MAVGISHRVQAILYGALLKYSPEQSTAVIFNYINVIDRFFSVSLGQIPLPEHKTRMGLLMTLKSLCFTLMKQRAGSGC